MQCVFVGTYADVLVSEDRMNLVCELTQTGHDGSQIAASSDEMFDCRPTWYLDLFQILSFQWSGELRKRALAATLASGTRLVVHCHSILRVRVRVRVLGHDVV
jgi:hypothetical protein